MQFLSLSLLLAFQLTAHPFFISICQIHHNSEAKTLEVAIKLFSNDLETAMEAEQIQALHLGTDREIADADAHIGQYLQQHLQLSVDGTPATGEFIGKEFDADVVWCYIEVPNVSTVSKLEVSNRLLMDEFPSQTNVVHITVNGERKSMLLQKGNARDVVSF